jgi:outer membrane protein OmpA-like peptidoglycan-associated protein
MRAPVRRTTRRRRPRVPSAKPRPRGPKLANAQQQLADLQAKKTDRGVVVTLGDVLFDTGQATLKPGANLALNRFAAFLSAIPQTWISVEGHTDSRGSDEYNEVLSERRARAVAAELISRGISPDQLQTLGRGKGCPVASNDTPEGRQQNRRVEIVFSDAAGHFAQGALQSWACWPSSFVSGRPIQCQCATVFSVVS